jgi:hypothetical protein
MPGTFKFLALGEPVARAVCGWRRKEKKEDGMTGGSRENNMGMHCVQARVDSDASPGHNH